MTDMTSEYVDSLKHDLDITKHTLEHRDRELSIVAHILSEIIERECIESSIISEIIGDMTAERNEIVDILDFHNVIDECYLRREYEVTITVPVSVTLTIEAHSVSQASENAMDSVECNGLEAYDMEYNVHYTGDVEEVREV
jgi:hypothetical protein